MVHFDRRTFIEFSTAALLGSCSTPLRSQAGKPAIASDSDGITIHGSGYSWSYTRHDDSFHMNDSKGRLIVKGPLQPVVVIASSANPAQHRCVRGRALPPEVNAGQIRFSYDGVNGSGRLTVTMRFESDVFWMDPVVYESGAAEDVVSLRYFAEVTADTPTPALEASFLVVPGLSEGSSLSPIVSNVVHLKQTVWLGHGDMANPSALLQQWALPLHYFCGFSMSASEQGMRNTFNEGRSDVFACGLADLPSGDLMLDLYAGLSSPWVDYRSDLWKQLRGPGRLTLGPTFCWTAGGDEREAIAHYYARLLESGIIRRKENSAKKNAAVLATQFCTWGSQVCRNRVGSRLDEAFLRELYQELKTSGMNAEMFSIDERWEGPFGSLQHSAEKFPHFEEFLNQIRADGRRIGMWTAFMRCEDPALLGLTVDNMLKQPDGTPLVSSVDSVPHYFFDFTDPQVEKALGNRARQFIRRYNPDLVKFDFGYELPAIRAAAPADKRWAGEKLLAKGLEVMITAMRQENPDLAVMYYQLSPLFGEYFDLHALDDLFLASSEYDIEANRRIYFSSLLGPLGIPTYGSTGYEWQRAPSIWFDAVASGTFGSINDFPMDQMGMGATPDLVARFNGLTHAIRPGNLFTVVPFPATARPQAPTRGAHSRSWARLENDRVVLIALRPVADSLLDAPSDLPGDPAIEDLVTSSSPVVVASKTLEAIPQSTQLAIVPYGEGRVSIRRERGGSAQVTTHYFGGGSSRSRAIVTNGRLILPLAMQSPSKVPVEWVEVALSS